MTAAGYGDFKISIKFFATTVLMLYFKPNYPDWAWNIKNANFKVIVIIIYLNTAKVAYFVVWLFYANMKFYIKNVQWSSRTACYSKNTKRGSSLYLLYKEN